MHPAVSVIIFTVLSGAGFGLVGLIGLGMPLPGGAWQVFFICLLAGGISVAGLLSSTFHLGHPERAWRAFSQWRTSWLSREGVLSVATLGAFALYGLIWMTSGERVDLLGYAIAVLSLLTVYSTAMIYGQLKTVPQWSQAMTPAVYLLYALASGFLIGSAFSDGALLSFASNGMLALLLLIVAWIAKFMWWRSASEASLESRGMTRETATGLGRIGKVRLLERPHSGENYLTREMIHKIGRKHALALRRIAIALGLVLPLLLCAGMLLMELPQLTLLVAAISMIAGLFAERWLFFAEAVHSVSLYYDEGRI
ncbi:MAG: DmsC/YnfH family molybdoenzyme membrane anchor subunit [Rhizobiaceae bacterium]